MRDLKEAGYEKKKQPWSAEEDARLMVLAARDLRWTQIAD
jgi:hypothetical protein